MACSPHGHLFLTKEKAHADEVAVQDGKNGKREPFYSRRPFLDFQSGQVQVKNGGMPRNYTQIWLHYVAM